MTARGWVIWAVMVTALALAVTNPVYLGLMVLGVLAVGLKAPAGPAASGLRPLLLAGLGIVVFAGFVAVVNGTPGSHVLFTVPGPDTPSWLGGMRFGGPVTREGLIAAGGRSLSLITIFGAFAVLTTTLPPSRLLRATPAPLFQAGLVLTIGLSILPATVEDVRRLREAEALRGRVLHWWDLPSMLPAAVLGGLERSVRLAEALEARGFGGGSAGRGAFVAGALAAPLLLLSAYLWLAGGESQLFALVPGLAGAGGLAWWLASAGTANRSSRLFPDSPRAVELTSLLVAGLALGVLLAFPDVTGSALRYDPFADSGLPPLSAAAALVPGLAAWPLAVLAVPRPGPPEIRAGATG